MQESVLDVVYRRLREEEQQLLDEQNMTELPYEKQRYEAILQGFRRARQVIRETSLPAPISSVLDSDKPAA